MNFKKVVILFVGLALPITIFLFLKIFGENKFEVAALFQTQLPENISDCQGISVPYRIRPETVANFLRDDDQLGVVIIEQDLARLSRITDQFNDDPINVKQIDSIASVPLKKCVFLLHEPYDVVLFDRQGNIRGQYFSGERDEIDRLILEITIILNK